MRKRNTKSADINIDNISYITNLKEGLINYLKTKNIGDFHSLWGYSKDFYVKQSREMGGSYASWGKNISVRLNNPQVRFDGSLE